MKLNKSKNKGKVHPSPSSSTTTNSASPVSLSAVNDTVSTLNNLLPAAILTLISILTLQDKEVLAYMITHSLSCTTTTTTISSFSTPLNKNGKKPCSKKATSTATVTTTNNNRAHKVPSFDCGCFECYTSYWFRWDSSPNRELIHQAIEAFEEHLTTCEQQKKNTPCNKSTKKKLKKVAAIDGSTTTAASSSPPTAEVAQPEKEEGLPEILPEMVGSSGNGESFEGDEVAEGGAQEKQAQGQQQQQHKGLARKVLPDVIGLFNSRLWNLWGPNV